MTSTISTLQIRARLMGLLTHQIPGFDEHQNLREQLDSLAFVGVIGSIEAEFGVSIYTVELMETHGMDVERAVDLIARRLGEKAGRE